MGGVSGGTGLVCPAMEFGLGPEAIREMVTAGWKGTTGYPSGTKAIVNAQMLISWA